jgi:hypothetical protein
MSETALTEGEILSHAIDAIGKEWQRDFAYALSTLSLPEQDLNRVDELLARNRNGMITDPEKEELENYLRVGNFIGLMRARALRKLQTAA